MSDIADRADWRIAHEMTTALAKVRRTPLLQADHHCHFCQEPIASALLFCNVDCRDDYEREQAALRRTGR